ncbi:MAG: hypothetical protein ABEN55_13805 [Bradymonadaceae bacterium]
MELPAIPSILERHSGDYEDEYDWETSDFYCRQLGDDHYLLTYTLVDNGSRVTRRSSIWRRTEGRWTIVYHQGTIVQDA